MNNVEEFQQKAKEHGDAAMASANTLAAFFFNFSSSNEFYTKKAIQDGTDFIAKLTKNKLGVHASITPNKTAWIVVIGVPTRSTLRTTARTLSVHRGVRPSLCQSERVDPGFSPICAGDKTNFRGAVSCLLLPANSTKAQANRV